MFELQAMRATVGRHEPRWIQEFAFENKEKEHALLFSLVFFFLFTSS